LWSAAAAAAAAVIVERKIIDSVQFLMLVSENPVFFIISICQAICGENE